MRLIALAVVVLIGCGDVAATARDAGPGDAAPADAYNPCAPATCLLADDFSGGLDPSRWAMTASPGATIAVAGGVLTIRLPAVANAFADVHSLVGFPVGSTFEASVTFSAGQFFDHKGAGFASDRVDSGCTTGESDAAMFRGQDADAYVETKAATTSDCKMTTAMYPGGTSKLQIARTSNQVVFTQNDVAQPPITTDVPTATLPIRFSAYTFTSGTPAHAVEIDVDYVFVRQQ